MARKLFCEISPTTYRISREKEIIKRKLKDFFYNKNLASTKSEELLPHLIRKHKSLIRRKLNNVDLQLQENKAKNLSLSAPLVNKILIRPSETFSFWKLVGRCSKKKGYLEGLTISNGLPNQGIGGGICQFTNLIHWMVLHTNLDIIEHHHHNKLDLFPDFNRQIPFGTGTSIAYNNLDYRFKNNTDITFQLITYTTDEYLCGEIRSSHALDIKAHIREEDAYFFEEEGIMYRHNKLYKKIIDKRTGKTIDDKMILENKSKIMYPREFIDKEKIKEPT